MEVLILDACPASLPQPDQLCGPFAAHAALSALLADPPSVVELARAAGTAIWPHDVPAWRPAGAAFVDAGWEGLPRCSAPSASGTTAAGLAAAVTSLTGLAVVPVPSPGAGLGPLLAGLVEASYAVAVVVNLLSDLGHGPVGHFAVVTAADPSGVVVADGYAELGEPGLPPGCHRLSLDALAEATAERGLLLVARPAGAEPVRALVAATWLSIGDWHT